MRFLFVLSVFVLTATFSFGQDAKSQAILDKLSNKIKGMNSFYIEFNATVKSPKGKTESELGKGWVKGNKFSAVYGDITILSNGIKQWTIVKEDKSVYETSASNSDDVINPKKLMTIWEKDFKNALEGNETINGVSCSKIRLIPTNPGKAEYHSIYVFVAGSTNELKRAIVKMKNGTTMTYTLTKFVENQPVEDANFVYNPKKYPGFDLIRD